jgi:hypothetical protein
VEKEKWHGIKNTMDNAAGTATNYTLFHRMRNPLNSTPF